MVDPETALVLYQSVNEAMRSMTHSDGRANRDLSDYLNLALRLANLFPAVLDFETGEMTIGRATYEPGWKWSEHVRPVVGTPTCQVEHVGIVVSGQASCAMDDGRIYTMKAGDIFYIGPDHDSSVVGD